MLVAQAEEVVVGTGQHREAGTGDSCRELLALSKRYDRVVASVDHECRHGDRRQDGRDVDLGDELDEVPGGSRRSGAALVAGEELAASRCARDRWCDGAVDGAIAPVFLDAFQQVVEAFADVPLDPGVVEGEPLDAVGVRGREDHRQSPSCGRAEHGCTVVSRGVHDDAEVVGALLEGRSSLDRQPIGEPGAALVEHHDAGEAAETAQGLGDAGLLPHELDVGGEPCDEHERGAVAEHLVRDRQPIVVR